MNGRKGSLLGLVLASLFSLPLAHAAETCTTQSQMPAAELNALAAAATTMANAIQSGNDAALKSLTIAEFQANFAGIAAAVASTAPQLKGAVPQVEGLYLLDATGLKTTNGVNPDAQFYCTLHAATSGSGTEVEFSIPQLPPGKYSFATVRMEDAKPWQLSFLMRQDAGKWMLAGLYPRPMTAEGHDGLWYWKQARTLEAQKQPWNAWLYLQEAQTLMLPANFVSSTHLEKLQSELQTVAPPAIANGLSADTPLVLKAPDGTEFRFTALSVDSSLGLDVAAHLKVESLDDAAAARKRNLAAMAALIAAHPELRTAFHGIWIFADAPGKAPYATEQAMAEIH
jgi:hypothetical protein